MSDRPKVFYGWIVVVTAAVGLFLGAFPMLLDKELFLRHWSRPTMFTPEARAAWRDPDLVALPF